MHELNLPVLAINPVRPMVVECAHNSSQLAHLGHRIGRSTPSSGIRPRHPSCVRYLPDRAGVGHILGVALALRTQRRAPQVCAQLQAVEHGPDAALQVGPRQDHRSTSSQPDAREVGHVKSRYPRGGTPAGGEEGAVT